VPCGLAEGKTVQCGSIGAAIISKQLSPLAAKAISNGNVVKLVDNLFHRLARKNEFFGNIQGFINRYYLNGLSVFRFPGGYGPVHRGSGLEEG